MRVGVLGFGHVAAATVQNFVANRDLIRSKTAAEIHIVRVATRTVSRAAGRVPSGCVVSDDAWSVVDDPAVDVVLELMGGIEPAKALVLRAIGNGKHVITANKALLAMCGDEILELADRRGVCVLFEGAVAVSIPIIKTLKSSAAANRVTSIVGILNGTSNYILTQMRERSVAFDDALADAQRKGYAEADPSLDVNGGDAAHKLTLLASLAFGIPIDFSAVEFEGITAIDPVDIQSAVRLGYQLKLVARAHLADDKVSIGVAPMLVPNNSLLAQVHGSFNGILLAGDLFGTAFFHGAGAGGTETASAVLADLIDLAQGTRNGQYAGPPNMGFHRNALTAKLYQPTNERQCRFYLRLRVDDKVGVLAEVSAAFAKAEVSVSTLLQDPSQDGMTDLIATTHAIPTLTLQRMLPALQHAAGPGHSVVIYPVLDELARTAA